MIIYTNSARFTMIIIYNANYGFIILYERAFLDLSLMVPTFLHNFKDRSNLFQRSTVL